MRYAQIREFDISNGEGIGVTLFTAGCEFHCKNCYNKELWALTSGKEWTKTEEDTLINLANKSYISRVTVLGGEPFLERNLEDLYKLVKRIRKEIPNKKIWIYSGNTYDVLNKRASKILENIDVLVDGLYVDELRDLNLKFKGSKNQRVIDVKQSLKENKVVLYMEDYDK